LTPGQGKHQKGAEEGKGEESDFVGQKLLYDENEGEKKRESKKWVTTEIKGRSRKRDLGRREERYTKEEGTSKDIQLNQQREKRTEMGG
jgi:hypothetical protein